jgi:cobalt/nickel transport system permease protein
MNSFPIQFAPAFAAAAPRGLSARLRGWRAGERWAGYLALLVAMAGVRTPLGAAAALGIGLLLLWVADRSRRQWARVGWLMPMLILFVAVGGLDLGGGARGIGIFGISFSAAGLEAGAVLAARCLALAMTGMSLVAICPPHAVLRDALPGWMPARARTLVWLTERAVHRVGREAVALRQAARARGFALTLHPRDLRTAARLAGGHFARCLRRSDRVYEAMLVRGFRGAARRLPPAPRQAVDLQLLAVFWAMAAVLLASRWPA